MKVAFTKQAADDLAWWKQNDLRAVDKIRALLANIEETPFTGLGKPEALKENLSGWWSRRITKEHRLVYRIKDGKIEVAQCRRHY